MPQAFYERLPHDGASWRGRTALLLWALGYPLEMAWSMAMTADAQHASDFKLMMARLEDDRLIAQLDATADFASGSIGAHRPSSTYRALGCACPSASVCDRFGRRLGAAILAVTDEPQSTQAWAKGARGEEKLAKALEGIEAVWTLHDRRMPGTRGNIDHIVKGPAGVS